MAALFQVVLFTVQAMRQWFGAAGVLVSSAIFGLTDVDALILSMARGAASGLSLETAAQAITIGALSNTLLKLAVAAAVGRGRFRWVAGTGLGLIGVGAMAALVAVPRLG
jgi:uncharacterized membrane protein (DUF4010 family)